MGAMPGAAQEGPERGAVDGLVGTGLVTTLAGEVVEVGMEHRSGHVMVDVWIHGEGPFPFVLDTCAGGHGRLDAALVKELGLKEVGSVMVGDGTGANTTERALVSVEALQIGDAAFEGLTMLAAPAEGGVEMAGRGILGIGLFEDLLLTLDYAGFKVRMEHGALDAGAPHVVPMDMSAGVPAIHIRIGETAIRAHVDSGNMGGLMLPGSYKSTLRLAGEPQPAGQARTLVNQFEMWSAPLADPVRFAGHQLDDLSTTFADLFSTANLGYRVLNRYEVTLDTKRQLVAFAPLGEAPAGPD